MNSCFNILKWALVVAFYCAVSFLSSCSGSGSNSSPIPGKDTLSGHTKPPSSFQDSLLINIPTAVFYEPDSVQKEKIRKVTEEGIFNSSMHEYYYQVRNAHILMNDQWKAVKIIDARHVRYLVFMKANGEREVIDLDKLNDAFGMIVFDTRQSPRILDMTNVENQLPDYFNN